jgi:endoglucanase
MREAIVIIEPDALAHISTDCPSDSRYADLSDAVSVFASTTKASTYLDAGHSAWIGANEMATRLQKANVGQARGFSLNISNFQTTASNRAYGDMISAKTGKSYVIDTSRNGQGPQGSEWCNPSGRGLGAKPAIVNSGNLDAYIWAKIPGESDGACNGGPAAGVWWGEYAAELIKNAHY